MARTEETDGLADYVSIRPRSLARTSCVSPQYCGGSAPEHDQPEPHKSANISIIHFNGWNRPNVASRSTFHTSFALKFALANPGKGLALRHSRI